MRKQSLIEIERIYRFCIDTIESSPSAPLGLPSEWELARQFSVSRQVARRALQQLVREGRANCHAGKGYYSRRTSSVANAKRLRVGVVYHPRHRAYVDSWKLVLSQICNSLEAHEFASDAIPIETPKKGVLTQRILTEYQVDAYLLCSVSLATQVFFANQGTPTVVLGNTIRDLGLASVSLSELDVAKQVTAQLLDEYRLVMLVQEKTLNLGAERSRLGFLYAHHEKLAHFHPEYVVRVDRERRGMMQELLRLFQMAPSAILVESVPLLEMIWSRASAARRKWLEKTNVVVLSPDITGALRHPARIVDFDPHWEHEAAISLLEDCVRGRSSAAKHLQIPWKLISATPSNAPSQQLRTTKIG